MRKKSNSKPKQTRDRNSLILRDPEGREAVYISAGVGDGPFLMMVGKNGQSICLRISDSDESAIVEITAGGPMPGLEMAFCKFSRSLRILNLDGSSAMSLEIDGRTGDGVLTYGPKIVQISPRRIDPTRRKKKKR